MSTLEYLDSDGTVNFRFVPWKLLNDWLSELNGNIHVVGTLRDGVNRGAVIEELNSRRKKTKGLVDFAVINRGYGENWLEYENDQGYTHLEELLIYQPKDWRKQAREYFFRFHCNLDRESTSKKQRTIEMSLRSVDNAEEVVSVFLSKPILIVLLHPEIRRTYRYQPLNFLLSYGVRDPIPNLPLETATKDALTKELSPLDYFFYFQENVEGYDVSILRDIGRQVSCKRLCLIKELDFSDVIGQRMAKQMIRFEVVNHLWNRAEKDELCSQRQPLSMIFSGPSGNGKTESAVWLSKLMNKPSDDAFLKVDCGKLRDANEVFGMSGAYQGASEGSALNNFVLRMSLEPESFGIVLLDEIEKADREVIHGLYQVIDKGEWTNKKLERGRATTITIPCQNLVFIMTTNAADKVVIDYAERKFVHGIVDKEEMEDLKYEIESLIRKKLQHLYPFTEAFIGRIGRIIPFFPMANGDLNENLLLGEMMVVAKLLIEREQERMIEKGNINVNQVVTAKEKHKMAQIIVSDAIPEAGVRSIQKGVETRMGKTVRHSLLLEKGGIKSGAKVRYFTNNFDKKVGFCVETSGNKRSEKNPDKDEAFYEDEETFA